LSEHSHISPLPILFCKELQKPFGSYLLPNFHNRRKPVQDKDSSCFLIIVRQPKVVHRIQSNSNSQKAFNFPKSGPSRCCLVKKYWIRFPWT